MTRTRPARTFLRSSRCAALGLLVGVMVGACAGPSFSCQDDAACNGGWCEPQGWCSFSDDTCDSGRRFGEHAGVGLAGECVEPVGSESSGIDDGAITMSIGDASASLEGSAGSSSSTEGGETTLPVDATTSNPSGSTSESDTSTGEPAVVHVGPLPIAANEDDGQMYQEGPAVTWLPSGEPDLHAFAGEYPVGARYFGYFRFALPIEIAADATIENAVLSIYGEPPYQWRNGDYRMGVWLQDTADAPAVQTPAAMPVIGGAAAPDELALSADVVAWPEDGPLPWTVGGWNETPDLGPLFTALVAARGGLAAGAHVQIWIAMYEPVGASAEIGFVDYAADPRFAARLDLDVAQ